MVLIFPEVVVFEHFSFGGMEQRFNTNVPWIGAYWNDKISSIIVISGTWQFFEARDYGPPSSQLVKPGWYSNVMHPLVNISDNAISSFKVVDWYPQGDNPVSV